MNTQSQAAIYRSLRQQRPFLPAAHAWRQASEVVETNCWAERVEFDWQGQFEPRHASWHEAGYDLTAHFPHDEEGWTMEGDRIGKFSNQWQPGAISHCPDNHRTFDWFIPADPSMAHWLYRRACNYGHDWDYRILVVTAFRNGIELASASLCGIESDSDESYLTGTVFDLKDEAIEAADLALHALCGCPRTH